MRILTRCRVPACLLSVVLWTGCSGGDHSAASDPSRSAPATVLVGEQTVEARHLSDTVTGLCLAREQASADPRAAEATYDRLARTGVETTTRALQRSYSVLASSVAEAAAAVESDVAADPPRPTLGLNLGRLTEKIREGLARLGVATSACKK